MAKKTSLVDRVVADTEVCHGKPRIKGTRIMVWQVLDLLAEGETTESIISDHYPDIKPEDIRACIAYANQYVHQEEVYPASSSASR